MKILILGATGGTGRLTVGKALARGHEVTVLVRSAEKARGLSPAKIVLGDARDEGALRESVRGQDAVISALGTPASPFREVTLLSSATRALVNAMKAEKVVRLVCITGIGAGDSRGHGSSRCCFAKYTRTRIGRSGSCARAGSSHGGSIARGDVASFVLDQAGDDTWVHRAPLISW